MTDTPETKAFKTRIRGIDGDKHWVPALFAERLERERDEAITRRMETIMQCELYEQERDEAREAFLIATDQMVIAQSNLREANKERDKARTELEMWRDGNIMHQIHRDELEKTERERDEVREALMKIEDLFIDGTDIYADREKMGTIAREALEETK
jgi:hypothetical protein